MTPAKEIDGELWVKASDMQTAVAEAVKAEGKFCAAVARQWDIDHPSSNFGGCIANIIEGKQMNDNILKHSTDLGIGFAPQPSGTITFLSGPQTGTVEVMRLSHDGVWVNPDIKPDEIAQAVLNALDYNIKLLVERAVLDEREACARICEGSGDGLGDEPVALRCADAIRSRT